jgi:hypothetical protein
VTRDGCHLEKQIEYMQQQTRKAAGESPPVLSPLPPIDLRPRR